MAAELNIPLEAVCRIIIRAREFEAQTPGVNEDDGSNASDDGEVEVLEDDDDEESAIEEELRAAIDDLNEDEQIEMVALALVGRGTYEAIEWEDALATARDEAGDVADYLLGLPMLAAYLDTGLAAFDLNCDGVGQVS